MMATAEHALVGSLILYPKKIAEVVGLVSPDDFADRTAGRVFHTVTALWKNRQPIDPVSVAGLDPELIKYVTKVTDSGSPLGCARYAETIAEAARDRRVVSRLKDIASSKTGSASKLSDVLGLYQQELSVAKKDASIASVLDRFTEKVRANKRKGAMGIPTGFGFLEEKFVQYVPGHIWTMGAFTSVGKTAMMIQKIVNLLSLDPSPTVLVISTEMTEEQLVSRLLANLSGVHSQRILCGNYRDAGEQELVEEWRKVIVSRSLFIHDDIYELGDIESAFRIADLRGGVDVGFIDYVQNCRNKSAANEYQANAEMAKRLQKLAKDVRCTLVCLSQVSNDVGRGNTDQLELKGAGEWAAVSDVGIMLQRNKTDKYLLKYLIKKNRHGALGEQLFEYKNDFTRLEPSQDKSR